MIVSKRSKAQGATRLIHTVKLNANRRSLTVWTIHCFFFSFLVPAFLPKKMFLSLSPQTLYQDFGVNQVWIWLRVKCCTCSAVKVIACEKQIDVILSVYGTLSIPLFCSSFRPAVCPLSAVGKWLWWRNKIESKLSGGIFALFLHVAPAPSCTKSCAAFPATAGAAR